MLELTVPTPSGEMRLQFEHSLRSLSKWEAKFNKPFLSVETKSFEELYDYFGMMLTSPEHDSNDIARLSNEQRDDLVNYMNTNPGATAYPPEQKGTGEQLTSGIIYANMVLLKIPWEAQDWHLHELLKLLSWVAYKQTPEKDRKDNRSVREKLTDWAQINAANKKRFNSTG